MIRHLRVKAESFYDHRKITGLFIMLSEKVGGYEVNRCFQYLLTSGYFQAGVAPSWDSIETHVFFQSYLFCRPFAGQVETKRFWRNGSRIVMQKVKRTVLVGRELMFPTPADKMLNTAIQPGRMTVMPKYADLQCRQRNYGDLISFMEGFGIMPS